MSHVWRNKECTLEVERLRCSRCGAEVRYRRTDDGVVEEELRDGEWREREFGDARPLCVDGVRRPRARAVVTLAPQHRGGGYEKRMQAKRPGQCREGCCHADAVEGRSMCQRHLDYHAEHSRRRRERAARRAAA